MKRAQIKVEYDQPREMAAAFGAPALGNAMVVQFDTLATMESKPTRVSCPGRL